jgi:hypothetical protein
MVTELAGAANSVDFCLDAAQDLVVAQVDASRMV